MLQSPFLNIGLTYAVFSFLGKTPVVNAKLTRNARGANSKLLTFFKRELDIPSQPVDVVDFNLVIMSEISCSVTGLKKMKNCSTLHSYPETCSQALRHRTYLLLKK